VINLDVVMTMLMFIVGYIVANFILTRLHGRTALNPVLSVGLSLVVLVLFTYLATYYKPEGLSKEELASALSSMRYRRTGLIAGEAAGLGTYFFKLRKARGSSPS